MLEGGDSSRGNLGAWRQVSAPFSSTIAAKAERLASHIQGQLARYLYLTRRPYLPIWLPDYSTLTSARWADRIISRVHSTLYSLPSVPYGVPPLLYKPASIVWFRPMHGSLATSDEGRLIEPDEVVGPEAVPFVPSIDGLHKPAMPDRGGERPIYDHHTGAVPGLNPLWGRAISFTTQLGYPSARRLAPPLRSGLLAQRDMPLGEDATPALVRFGSYPLVGATPADVSATTSGGLILPQGYDQSTATGHYERQEMPRFPQTIRPVAAKGYQHEPLIGPQKALAFAHQIVGATTAMPRQQQVVMPLLASIFESQTPRLPELSEMATTLAAPAEVGRYEYQPASWLPTPVIGIQGRISPQMTTSAPRLGEPPHRAWTPLRTVSLPQEANLVAEAGGETGMPSPFDFGAEHGSAGIASFPPQFVYPSRLMARPAFDQGFAEQAVLDTTGHRAIVPQHDATSLSAIPTSPSPPLAQTPAQRVVEAGTQVLSGVAGHSGSGPSPRPALAPIGRPRGTSGDVSAPAEVIAESAAGHQEGAEEAAEPNLDRLARDVYVVLKRRLAWEKERSLVLRS